jgi:hypothetical protein
MLAKLLFSLFICIFINANVKAKLFNSFEENRLQYGEPIDLEVFPSKKGFSGFATYNLNLDWKIKAFFIDDEVRSEHLIQNKGSSKILNRDEVREKALLMFDTNKRGAYKQQLTLPRIEGHFFDKGLIAYEYELKGKKNLGYKSVRVLIYENNHNFNKVNPKAYL